MPEIENEQNQENQEKASEGSKESERTVPLSKFIETKKTAKELEAKIASYETRDREAAEAKLKEEKRFEELLLQKDAEAKKAIKELEETKQNFKVSSVKEKLARALDRNEAIDSDDILRLIEIDPLIEAEDQNKLIEETVNKLKTSKPYLFKVTSKNSHSENSKPSDNQRQPEQKSRSSFNIFD